MEEIVLGEMTMGEYIALRADKSFALVAMTSVPEVWMKVSSRQ
jgi:hypothetical protein